MVLRGQLVSLTLVGSYRMVPYGGRMEVAKKPWAKFVWFVEVSHLAEAFEPQSADGSSTQSHCRGAFMDALSI